MITVNKIVIKTCTMLCATNSSSMCHQTSVFHLSTHLFAASLNLLRSSNEQGCARRLLSMHTETFDLLVAMFGIIYVTI